MKSFDSSSTDSVVPLDDIAAKIKTSRDGVAIEKRKIRFPAGQSETVLEVTPVHLQTPDGLEVSEVITVSTAVLEADVSFSDIQITAVNRFAALSASVRDEKDGTLRIVSRLSAYKGDEAAWELYSPLLASTAVLQGETFAKSLGQVVGLPQEPLVIPQMDQPSRWRIDDFDAAIEPLKKNGIFANAGETGLTAEFPLEPGAFSAMLGDKTSLLTFQTDMPHPALGNGLFVKLELPMQFPMEELSQIANKLNWVELESIDAVPFVGAWTASLGTNTLAHVCFWPNFMYRKGLILNLCFWMGHRNRHVRAFVENFLA
jgi:hypothetical protein